jgi:chemotaxis protein histidine kinase CheA
MNPELKEILAGLKRDYLKSLPDKIAAIEKLWKSDDVDLMETEFHKLKGTGKTYGLPEISELGLIAENLCSAEAEARNQAVRITLSLLGQIHKTRLRGKEFDLRTSKEFAALVALQEK